MRRRIVGLSASGPSEMEVPDGRYLARITRAQHKYEKRQPSYVISFEVMEPASFSRYAFASRISCDRKTMWRLNWFLRDFGYDTHLLENDEVDERALQGLIGVVWISYQNSSGRRVLRLDGFAPAERWAEFHGAAKQSAEVA